MARTLFFLEAILLLLASSLLSTLGAHAFAAFAVPAAVAILVPLLAACAAWPARSVLKALGQAFTPGRPGAGAEESKAILGALVGFSGLGAAAGTIGASIALLFLGKDGGDLRPLAWQALAFCLFGVCYAMIARILGKAVQRADRLPGNGDSSSGIPGFSRKYGLSPRESEVAALLVEGRSYQEIADSLFISIKTVKTHVSRVYGKSGCPNKIALVLLLREETQESYERPMAAEPAKKHA